MLAALLLRLDDTPDIEYRSCMTSWTDRLRKIYDPRVLLLLR